MKGSELRPAVVLILNFVAGYAVVSLVVGWLRRKAAAGKRKPMRGDFRPPGPPEMP